MKRFNNFNNGMKLFRKIKSGKMKLEEAKKLQNVFKSNLNKISRGKYKWKGLLNYLMIIIQLHLRVTTKKIHGKRIRSMSARGRVATVSDHSNLKTLSPK